MAVERERPYLNGNFHVDLGVDDVQSVRAGFAEVILPDAAIDVIEYRNGNEKANEVRKLAGFTRYENLVLRRGLIGATDLYEWWNEVRDGSADVRRNVTVRLLTEDRADVVFEWRFTNAWPIRYGFSRLSGDGEDVVVEEIEVTFERMDIA